jgi:hypothetical protein
MKTKLELLKELQEKYSKELDLFVKENNGINKNEASSLVGSIIFDVLDIVQGKK